MINLLIKKYRIYLNKVIKMAFTCNYCNSNFTEKSAMKGISNQSMKWSTSDVKGVNLQQIAKISLQLILSQSMTRINSSTQNAL